MITQTIPIKAMEQHIILIISALTLIFSFFVFFIDQRRRLSNKIKNYILEKMGIDKGGYPCKRSQGHLSYISNEEIYDELKDMIQYFTDKNNASEKGVSEKLLGAMNRWFPFARFRK